MFQRKVCRALARELGCIGQSGLNIRLLNRRVAADDFFSGHARSKVVENHGNHHARASDTRLSVTNGRINTDALLPVGHASFYIAVRRCPIWGKGECSRETPNQLIFRAASSVDMSGGRSLRERLWRRKSVLSVGVGRRKRLPTKPARLPR